MMEKSLVLIKPDAVQRGLVGEIISRFEKCGLKIIGMKMMAEGQFPRIFTQNWHKDTWKSQKKRVKILIVP